jgi:hypothetical protein
MSLGTILIQKQWGTGGHSVVQPSEIDCSFMTRGKTPRRVMVPATFQLIRPETRQRCLAPESGLSLAHTRNPRNSNELTLTNAALELGTQIAQCMLGGLSVRPLDYVRRLAVRAP